MFPEMYIPNSFGREEVPPYRLSNDKAQAFVSLLYKSARIGDAKTAMVMAGVIKACQGEMRLVGIMNQLVGEDLHPIYYQKLFPLMQSWDALVRNKVSKGHNTSQNVYLLAKAPKWYMENSYVAKLTDTDIWDGVELEAYRQHIAVELELKKPHRVKEFVDSFPVPHWVYDRHTSRGWEFIKQKKADLRLDGEWDNRYKVKAVWDGIANANPAQSYADHLAAHKAYYAQFA